MVSREKKTMIHYVIRVTVTILILILIPVLINQAFGNVSQFRSFIDFVHNNSIGFTLGMMFWLGNEIIGRCMGSRLKWLKNPGKANMISLLFYIGFGMFTSLIVPFIYLKYVWETGSEDLLNEVMEVAFVALCVDIIIISVYYSRFIVKYWLVSIKNEEELKAENLLTRYEALKNQVNPHFLFNTLNTLTGVVELDPDKASEFIRKLSDIYRYVLDQKDKELTTLDHELKFIKDFIYLLKIRYGNGLNIKYNIGEYKIQIVPLGLQMLIENAIKHNEISDDRPLTIEIGAENKYIYVKNTLQRKSSIENTNQIGLENLIKRYEYLSDIPVEIIETESHFNVKLPVIKN